MGKPLMIQEYDHRRIEQLKARLGVDAKIDIVRAALDLLEQHAAYGERVARWRKAAARVAAGSRRVNADFRKHSRLKRT
jgi:hypothetical protein